MANSESKLMQMENCASFTEPSSLKSNAVSSVLSLLGFPTGGNHLDESVSMENAHLQQVFKKSVRLDSCVT